MRIGPYETVERIGEGGAGLVYRARTADGREVAVKVLRRGATSSRFEREARLLGDLGEGEGYVPLLDAGEASQGRYIVMPFLAGGTLRKRLEQRMDPDEVLELGIFLAGTLGRAHVKGIVHRDLKPENILFTDDGRPLVADLGLAKHFDKDAPGASQSVSLSRGGEMRGTAGYMAPEQMKDARNVGPTADVFAIGAILYECLTGEPAFTADNMLALFEKVESGRHVPLKSARRDTPSYLIAVVERALAVDPARRYPDGDALLDALEHPRAPSGPGLGPLVAVLALVATAVVVAIVAVVVSSRTPPPTPPVIKPPDGPGPVTSRRAEPAWLLALAERDRPKARGVTATETPGEWRNEKDGTILVRVPAGDCKVGPAGKVRATSLPQFWISKFEVTNAQFARFVAETRHVTSAEEKGGGFVHKLNDSTDELLEGWDTLEGATWRRPTRDSVGPHEREPVIQLSWLDAVAYSKWAGLSLPDHDQWEKAASWDPATKKARVYPWGDVRPVAGSPGFANLIDHEFYKKYEGRAPANPTYEDGVSDRAPVGSFALDRSPCGAMDMGGNVSEWCRGGGTGELDLDMRAYRGGNWCSTKSWAQSAFVIAAVPANSSASWTGFRPILER